MARKFPAFCRPRAEVSCGQPTTQRNARCPGSREYWLNDITNPTASATDASSAQSQLGHAAALGVALCGHRECCLLSDAAGRGVRLAVHGMLSQPSGPDGVNVKCPRRKRGKKEVADMRWRVKVRVRSSISCTEASAKFGRGSRRRRSLNMLCLAWSSQTDRR